MLKNNFEKFLEKLYLTSDQEGDAKIKYDGVCKKLHDHYYPSLTYNGSSKILIGSYGKNTNIRPPRDIDVLFKMPDDRFARYDLCHGNGQSQLLQDIRNLLKDKYSTTESIRGWGNIVLIEFSEGKHNIELLPAWQLSNGQYKIPNSENGGSWKIVDPKAEINNIQESNQKTGVTLKLIRMLKRWQDFCNIPIKSFVLEFLVVKFFNQTGISDKDPIYYGEVIKNFLKFYIDSPAGNFLMPGTFENIYYNDEWKSKLQSAYDRALKALSFEKDGKDQDAANEWKKIFGDEFPAAEAGSKNLPKQTFVDQYPSSNEKYITDLGIKMNPIYSIRLNANVKQAGFRDHLLLDYPHFLKKKLKLEFFIQKGTVPAGYKIMWKVKNQGEEAKMAGDLRGEITPDGGHENKIENTKYAGKHYVECYIILDGVCIAFDRIFVPIGNN